MNRPEKLDILNGEWRLVERSKIQSGYDDVAAKNFGTDFIGDIEVVGDIVPDFLAEESDVPVVVVASATKAIAFDT